MSSLEERDTQLLVGLCTPYICTCPPLGQDRIQSECWDAYIITTIPERTLDGLNILDFLDFTRITSTMQVLVTLYTYGMQQTFWSADHHDLSVAVVAMLAVPGQRERLVVQC